MSHIEISWLPRVAAEVQVAGAVVEIIYTGEAQVLRDIALSMAEEIAAKIGGTVTWVGVARRQ